MLCSRHTGHVHFLPSTADAREKAAFLGTCDACIHARMDGETFGLAVAECSAAGLPVITFAGENPGATFHLRTLGEHALGYRNSAEFLALLRNFDPLRHQALADVYRGLYRNASEERVMVEFVRAFRPDAPPKC